MDPISTLASGIAIAGLAQKVIKKSAQAFDRFREAPSELNSLKRKVLLLQSLAKQIEARRAKLSLDIEVEHSLHECLSEAEEVINDLLKASQNYIIPVVGLNKRTRLKWAFKGSPAIEKCERGIEQTLETLNSIILTIVLSNQDDIKLRQDLTLAGQDTILAKHDTLVIAKFENTASFSSTNIVLNQQKVTQEIVTPTAKSIRRSSEQTSQAQYHLENVPGRSQTRSSQPYTQTQVSSTWLSYFGFMWSLVQQKGKDSSTTSASFRYRVPKLWKRQAYLVLLDFAFQVRWSPWRVSGLYFNLMVPNVVAEDAAIVVACEHGSLDLVKKLFMSKIASVYDFTPGNISLLGLAIEGGHLELVRLLLDERADVNQTFGMYQTSALQRALYLGQYDITKLLLNRGADGTHISACYGWGPLMHLLEGAQRFEETQTHTLLDFLDAMNNNITHIDTEALEFSGQNALQIASAWYPGDVLQRLFNLGASLKPFGRNPWKYLRNPIWNAICTNNVSAFRVLLPYYKNLDAMNLWRFKMLNYTARNGNIEMTNMLLEAGAEDIIPEYDPDVDGDIKLIELPDVNGSDIILHDDQEAQEIYEYCEGEYDSNGDFGTDLNNLEGMQPWTRENYVKYLSALKHHGRIAVRPNNTDEGIEEDVFWDAMSYRWNPYKTSNAQE